MVRRIQIFVFCLFLMAILVSKVIAATSVTSHKIVIDPGHGGSDPGSTECPTLTEADANLDIAQRLYTLLDRDGAQVLLTRTDDYNMSNADRYNAANTFGGEALVSIHLNGSTDHTRNGTLGLYGKLNKDLEFTKVIHSRLAAELDVPDIGVTNFASGVLLKSNMPATMQETVYISNTVECAALTDGTGARQQQIAQSLYNGLIDWFAQNPGGDDGGGNGGGKKCASPPCNKN